MDNIPYHADELAAQALAGGGARGAGIRTFMPEQHRTFFAMLPYVFVGAPDSDGWPLATVLVGEPGFVHAPDEATLRVDVLPVANDPLAAAMIEGREIGLIGVDFSTRRRNRANGRLAAVDAKGITIAVAQSFGNCPQYIQRRTIADVGGVREVPIETLGGLDAAARATIAEADTLFVASRARDGAGAHGGTDVSHRGGRPGFVGIEGDTLVIPDFSGNRYFNTLGNFLGEPRGALLFVDFESGDILQLQGRVEIDWSQDSARDFEGAQRLWRFQVGRLWRRRGALAARWTFIDYAPQIERTGTWSGQPVVAA